MTSHLVLLTDVGQSNRRRRCTSERKATLRAARCSPELSNWRRNSLLRTANMTPEPSLGGAIEPDSPATSSLAEAHCGEAGGRVGAGGESTTGGEGGGGDGGGESRHRGFRSVGPEKKKSCGVSQLSPPAVSKVSCMLEPSSWYSRPTTHPLACGAHVASLFCVDMATPCRPFSNTKLDEAMSEVGWTPCSAREHLFVAGQDA